MTERRPWRRRLRDFIERRGAVLQRHAPRLMKLGAVLVAGLAGWRAPGSKADGEWLGIFFPASAAWLGAALVTYAVLGRARRRRFIDVSTALVAGAGLGVTIAGIAIASATARAVLFALSAGATTHTILTFVALVITG